MKAGIRLAGCVCLALLRMGIAVASTDSAEGGVYVAGQGFSLEQAVEQALDEQVGEAPFWIVASGSEARRIAMAAEERSDTQALLKQVRERGGIIYACGSDLPADRRGPAAVLEGTLPEGVGLVRRPKDEQEAVIPPIGAEEDALPESVPQSRLILRACAALQ